MATSSKLTDESSHPYDTLPNDQGFESIISDTKFTADTKTDLYDRSLTSRRNALVRVAFSSIFSCSCIVAGIVALANHGVSGVTNVTNTPVVNESVNPLPWQGEILVLALTFIVMLCTESIGIVHGIALHSALASESRLHFNTNLRLLTAARGWYNPNGTLFNAISAVLLIISYSLASLVVCPDNGDGDSAEKLGIAGLPLLVLGIALLLQVMIALSGMRAVKILTWSSSPFDLTVALVHHTQLTPVTLRCMRCVSDIDTDGGPAKPSEIQPSAWHAHPSIRKVVIFLWVIIAACVGWAALVTWISAKHPFSIPMTTKTWSFLPNESSSYIVYFIPGVSLKAWILLFVNVAVVQGPLTLGLHCSGLIANVIQDERQWRCATGSLKGLTMAMNPVTTNFTHPICVVLFVAKPFLRESFSSSIYIGVIEYYPR
jgi:hypothetical protein